MMRKLALLAALLATPAMAGDRVPLDGARATLLAFEAGSGVSAPAEVPPGSDVPFRVGESCYGWRLSFAPLHNPVVIEEVLVLPGSAGRWTSDTITTVSPDMTSARTTVHVERGAREASHSWCVADGDPEGDYVYIIYLGDRIVATLPFHVASKPGDGESE